MPMYKPRTRSGHPLDEVASDLQKSIRRGLLYPAVVRAKDLSRSGFANYAWARARVVCSEDIGVASPDMPAVIHALYEAAVLATKKRNPSGEELHKAGELHLVHAVILLCLAPKSRVTAEIGFVAQRNFEKGEVLAIPPYSVDMHTDRGRTAGLRKNTRAGMNAWRSEGKIIANEVPIDGGRWSAAASAEWDEILASLDDDDRS